MWGTKLALRHTVCFYKGISWPNIDSAESEGPSVMVCQGSSTKVSPRGKRGRKTARGSTRGCSQTEAEAEGSSTRKGTPGVEAVSLSPSLRNAEKSILGTSCFIRHKWPDLPMLPSGSSRLRPFPYTEVSTVHSRQKAIAKPPSCLLLHWPCVQDKPGPSPVLK